MTSRQGLLTGRAAIPRQNTEAWFEWRRGGMGASELPALVGEDPYRGEYTLALQKRGEVEPEPESWVMRLGHLVEPLGLQLYRERTGRKVRDIHTTQLARDFPHVYASLDGRVVGERIGVEVKWSRWDTLPRRVEIQCQAQAAVCRLEAIDVVRVHPWSEPLIVTVEADHTVGTALLELAEGWYRRYVLGDEMPPMDGSREASRALDRVQGPPEMSATEYQTDLVRQLHALRQRMKDDGNAERLMVNHLKDSMAGAEALTGEGFRISWKQAKPRHSTDWQALASHYRSMVDAPAEVLDELEQRHTEEKEGSRPFRLTVEEEE